MFCKIMNISGILSQDTNCVGVYTIGHLTRYMCILFYMAGVLLNLLSILHLGIYEPPREKTGFLHMRKQRRRSASR